MKKLNALLAILLASLISGAWAIDPAPLDCFSHAGCEKTQYCARAPGACHGRGTCADKAEFCTTEYLPVCGCDGMTYGNSCEAAQVGVNVAHEGECKQDTACKTNSSCTDINQYCAKPAGKCVGKGMCSPLPEVCTLDYDPVCGCTGQTYNNSCVAAQAGINVAYKGECASACVPTAKKERGRLCRDGLDNDCDGLTDLLDRDCRKWRKKH